MFCTSTNKAAVGRVFSSLQGEDIREFGGNQRVESFTATAGCAEGILKGAGVALGLGIFLSRSIDRRVGQADHHASNRPQNPCWSGSPDPALIFSQGDIQAMVQPAFDHPIGSLEREHPLGLELLQSQAADQVNGFPAPFAFALDPCLQSSGQPSSRKAGLARRHFQALQKANFQASAVVLPFQDPGLGCGLRGKNSVWRTEFRGFYGSWAGCL